MSDPTYSSTEAENLATRYSALFRDHGVEGNTTVERFEQFLEREGLELPTGPNRQEVLGDLLARELEARRVRGDNPRIAEYRLRFPNDIHVVEHVFNARTKTPETSTDQLDEELLADQIIDDRFRVETQIGRGGLGRVYRAFDAQIRRTVALKEIRGRSNNPETISRFRLEAEVTGGLQHPGIAPIYHLGTLPDGRPYYTMQLISGHSLEHAIRQYHHHVHAEREDRIQRRLALRHLLRHFVDVCQTIDYAHERGVIHRDLKPANVMLGHRDRETVVVDWGIALPTGHRLNDPAGLEAEPSGEPPLVPGPLAIDTSRLIAGTLAYMSPEQTVGGPFDARTDIFGLGAILHQIVSGRPPVSGQTPAEQRNIIQNGGLENASLGAFPRHLRPLAAISRKATAVEPADRYATARALANEVERWLADEPVSAYREPWPAKSWRWIRNHRTTSAVAAAVLLLGMVALTALSALQTKARSDLLAKNLELTQAYRAEAEAHQRTENWQRSAFNTIGEFRDTVVSHPELTSRPELDGLRLALLRRPLRYFQQFRQELLRQAPDNDPAAMALLGQIMTELVRTRRSIDPGESIIPLCLETEEVLDLLIAQHPLDAGRIADRAEIRTIRGRALRESGELVKAGEIHQSTIEELSAIDPSISEDSRFQLARIENLLELGLVASQLGQSTEAETLDKDAIALIEPLLEQTPNDVKLLTMLVRALGQLGIALARQPDRMAEALSVWQRGVDVGAGARDLPPSNDSPLELSRNVANCQSLLVAVLAATGQFDSARETLQQARSVYETYLADYPRVPALLFNLATCELSLGEIEKRTGNPDLARSAYLQAFEIVSPLRRDYPENPQYQSFQGNLQLLLGRLAETSDDPSIARTHFQASLPELRAAVASNPDQPLYRNQLSDGLLAMARLNLALEKDFESVADLLREMVDLTPDRGIEAVRLLCGAASSTSTSPDLDRDDYLDFAVKLLRSIHSKGMLEPASVLADPALILLHDRDDFQALNRSARQSNR